MRCRAFAAISPHQQAISRLKFTASLFATIVAVSGCVSSPSEVIRTPLQEIVKVSQSVQTIPIAVLEFASVPRDLPEGERTFLISFPDEIMVELEDKLVFRPSATMIPVTDVLMHGFRYAGLNVELYRTLSEANKADARIAILGALTIAEVNIAKVGVVDQLQKTVLKRAEAIVEIAVTLIDLRTAEILWTGSLKAIAHNDKAAILGLEVEADAGSSKGELRAQRLRALLTQCYFHLSMDLVSRLGNVLSGAR